jgi:periplasmic copper chaperone A
VSLPRPAARLGIVLTALVGLLTTLGIGVASAHVTVSSPDASQGGFGKVVFRVPNESDTASTVKLRIQLPPKAPLASVSVMPVPGWTVAETRATLDQPVTNDDGEKVTEIVSVVEFDAAKGGGIAPGQFQEFSLSVGPLPKADSLAFNVVQSFSDGSETAWIEPTVAGGAEPEHPAPVLALGSSAGTSAAAPAADPSSAAHADHTVTTTDGPASQALFVSILALFVGLGGVALGLTARRRTVAE